MRFFLLLPLCALAVPALASGPQSEREQTAAADLNVNTRYTVERVDLLPDEQYELSRSVKEDIRRIIGDKLNFDVLNRIAGRLAEELRAPAVTFNVLRGERPANVRVEFQIDKEPTRFEASIAQFSYVSGEGASGTAQVTGTLGSNKLVFAALSNADDQPERYSGVRARYERLSAGPEWLRLALEFDIFKDDLSSVPNSSLGAGADRFRINIAPSAIFVLAKPLTLNVGLSFEQTQPGFGFGGSGESAYAVFSDIHYDRRWEDLDAATRELQADYLLRTATHLLGSGDVYSRHLAKVRYKFSRQPQSIEVAVMAGWIYGNAPLFERFVLGNSETLRGWNKFELDPAGGNRMAHASVTYGYHIMRVFYDTGAIWDRGQRPEQKHSVGAGVTTGLGVFGKDALLLAVAFPLGAERVLPVFVAGMNF